MNKQNINLEQLYRERFTNFTVESSPNAVIGMQQKLRYAKKLALIKWAIGMGLLVTVTVATTLCYFYTDCFSNKIADADNNHTKIHRIEQDNLTNTEHIKIDKNQAKASKNHILETTEINSSTPKKDLLIRDAYTMHNSPEIKANENSKPQRNLNDFNQKGVNNNDNISPVNHQTKQDSTSSDLPPAGDYKSIDKQIDKELNIDKTDDKTISVKAPKPDKPMTLSDKIDSNSTQKSVFDKLSDKDSFNNNKIKNLNNKTVLNGNKLFGKWNGYLDVHWSPFIWSNNARNTSPSLDQTYTYDLKDKALFSYETGIALQLHRQNLPVFFELGVNYQSLRENIDYNIQHTFEDSTKSYWQYNSVLDIKLDTICVVVDSIHFEIDTIFMRDTTVIYTDSTYVPFIASDEKTKVYTNTYRYLNIPLLLGYQFHTNNTRWKFQVLAGVSIGINLHNKGWYYTKAGVYRKYAEKVYPSIAWSLYAASNVSYQWKKWLLFVQPEFQYQWHESSLDAQMPRRKYQFYKLRMGIRYKLF